MQPEIRFDYSKLTTQDAANIQKCVSIAAEIVMRVSKQQVDKITLAQDLATVHCMDRPMNFFEMSLIDTDKLMHDVALIYRNLNRRTGKLADGVQLFYQRKNPRVETSLLAHDKNLLRD